MEEEEGEAKVRNGLKRGRGATHQEEETEEETQEEETQEEEATMKEEGKEEERVVTGEETGLTEGEVT